MNAGLSNLTTLKDWLLAAAQRAATDYDEQILAIGRGVAAQFDEYCNRKLARLAGATFETNANRALVIVDHYPIETVTKIEVRDDLSTGYVDQGTVSDVLFNIRAEAGICEFAGFLGGSFSRLRITYSGGYFFEQLEPTDIGYPTALPSGATQLDPSLKLAWLLQCGHVWQQIDKLGLALGEKPDSAGGSIARIQLLSTVADQLKQFTRYAIT